MTKEHKKFIRGLLLAPLLGGYFAIILVMWFKNLSGVTVIGVEPSFGINIGDMLAVLFIAIFYATIASPIFYLGMLGAGLPIFWLLQKYDVERWWSYLMAGVVVGTAIPPLVGQGILPRALNGVAAGLILFMFWFVARRGVEDNRTGQQA